MVDAKGNTILKTMDGIGATFYGRAKKLELFGQERAEAEAAGFLPCSYQVVVWFVIFFLPVFPLGTYRVLKEKQHFWTTQKPKYRFTAVSWDWAQVFRHYAFVYAGMPLALFLLGAVVSC